MLTIFKKVTRAQATSATLLSDQQLKPFVDLIKETLEETKTSLVNAADTVHIHRLQGRAQVLDELLELAEHASRILSGMK